MEELALVSGYLGEARISGWLAFGICLVCHQALLFGIGRWTVELDGWRALFTTMAGVAGLSIGSVVVSPWAAPVGAVFAAFVVMRYVYEMDGWQQAVMAAGWYAFSLGSLLLAGGLFGNPASDAPPRPPVDKQELIESLRKTTNKARAEGTDANAPSPHDKNDGGEKSE